MRTRFTLVLLPLLAACTIEQQNGEFRAEPAPIFGLQEWRVDKKAPSPTPGTCVLSYGELTLTLTRTGKEVSPTITTEVITSSPGTRDYALRVAGHKYTALGNRFSAGDSRAIIQDFMNVEKAYSEWLIAGNESGANWKRFSNTLNLTEFPARYRECERRAKK